MAKTKTTGPNAVANKNGNKPKGPSQFELTIKAYLDKQAAEDEIFAKNYAKPHKSIDRCCAYIYGEMKKRAQNNIAVGTDQEVFGMAIHYYDEENLEIDKKPLSEVKQLSSSVKTASSEGTKSEAMPEVPDFSEDIPEIPYFESFDMDMF